ncbi:MAG: type VI secretion system baseplate subunit TssE [Phycisphaeraceae bacterium]|nr:MAG: type VI secretion system baseplate subunit TssE [Phycisphaeraceae bacterium]
MAELTPTERLQPCLLDRLTDDEPGKSAESRDKRVFSTRQMRLAVLRDLNWLLNTAQRMGPDEEAETPEVCTSVINFGVPDLCGLTAGGLDIVALERIITKAIRAYEPRIRPGTLRVTANVDDSEMSGNALTFEVRGDLWAQPIPEPMFIKTEIDLETGQYAMEDLARS